MTSLTRTSHSSGADLGNCHNVRSLMEAFVDGELSPEQTLEIEAHVDDCRHCQASADFLRTLSATVRGVVHAETARLMTSPTESPAAQPDAHALGTSAHLVVEASAAGNVSPSFMARLERAIEVEIERESMAADQTSRGTWVGRITVFAAAASATLWFGVRTFGPEASSLTATQDGGPVQARTRNSGVGGVPLPEDEVSTLEGALDRLIDYHSAPPAPDVTSADLLPRLEPDVGVRMQLPKLDAYGARWEGASLVPVRNNQRAASFRYQLPNKNRVTLYVFNASRLRVQDSAHLQRETPQPVYFGQWRGYNVAAKETHGVGYALATDMDGPAVARMINDVH